jgi:transcription elongation GreA/GreB family factor
MPFLERTEQGDYLHLSENAEYDAAKEKYETVKKQMSS